VPLSRLESLSQDPEVAYISPDRPVSGANDYAEATVGADVAQNYGYDGTGVAVAVIDSGISDHPDLHDPVTGQSRVVYSQTFIPGSDTLDHFGHGTHVAGIIAGNGQASGGKSNPQRIYGVAPNVRLVNLKVLDANGAGQDSYVIAALQRAVALKNTYGIRVINLSLGRPVYESFTQDPLCQAVEAAWNAGIVVVVAAGNQGRNNDYNTQGYGMIAAPGNDPDVITVGAMNTMSTPTKADDLLASYSSKGPTLLDHIVKPDVVAPGNRIASLLVPNSTLANLAPLNIVSPTTYGGSQLGQPYYIRLSGTSMATPIVSGAAALMLDADSTLSPNTIKARLMKTADKVFPQYTSMYLRGILTTFQYDIFSVGAGYVNIPAALNSQDIVQGIALSPSVTLDTRGNIRLVNAATSVFSNSVVWGNSLVWGNTALSADSVVWGSSVVWGNSGCDGFSVVWGSSVVWGNITGTSNGNDALSIDDDGDPDGNE
jgi:serine protease AprX